MNIRSLLVLLAFTGLIAACETVDPLIRDAQLYVQGMDYEEALNSAELALEENPYNALAHYYKGVALGEMSVDMEPPAARNSNYSEMKEAFGMAIAIGDTMETRPEELDGITEFTNSIWAYEHNAGAEIMTSDSVRAATQQPEQTAIAHFENAITVEPDSSISHIVLSSILYQLGEIERATSAYENAMTIMDQPVKEDYEFLISLYFMQEDFDSARNLAEEALDAYPTESIFAQFLADSYLETGQTEEALNMLRNLISEDPDNAQFRFALGTQLYRLAQDELDAATAGFEQSYQMEDQLQQLSQSERSELQGRIDEARAEANEREARGDELADQAIEQMSEAVRLDPDNDEAYNILGIIYQNRAAALFDKRNNTRDNAAARELDEEARETLRSSLENYEQAAELNPDETTYWESLFQVYTTLGMDEEAEQAMERAGM
ncbi:MAG: tetratricopeptide repeat protein [Balneolaceae bacterium]